MWTDFWVFNPSPPSWALLQNKANLPLNCPRGLSVPLENLITYVGIAISFAHLQISALLVRISKNLAKYVQI